MKRIRALNPGISWLDLKLGFRMLVKYPGLTVVGGLAIAFAIWVGAGGFEILTQVLRPSLPLPGGDRIVGIQVWDRVEREPRSPFAHDFVTWREQLTSVQEVGAFRTVERNLAVGVGRGEPTEVAEISAAAFRVARVPPLLGRHLDEADEQPGAAPVAVIGHDVWQARFGGAPDVIGREIRLGGTPHAVVGVMAPGFAFPISHSIWIPLHLNGLDYQPGQGPPLQVFGRLAPGATLQGAQAELAKIGAQAASSFPRTHEHLRPQALPYAAMIVNPSGEISIGLTWLNAFLLMLLVLVFGNIALLIFARAAARENEIAVRNALGASRARIVGQLFAEALVLGTVGAVVGLAAAGFGLRVVLRVYQAEAGGRLPFWFDASLSPTTVLYAAVLTVLGAAVAGVVPALKVTRGLGTRLRQGSAGGGGFRFGGVWTATIVAQVAVTVAFPAVAFLAQQQVAAFRSADVGFASEKFLAVRLETDRAVAGGAAADTSGAAFLAQLQATYRELERRLEAEPGVAAVTFADRLPRMYHSPLPLEVDDGEAGPVDGAVPHQAATASVDAGFFDALGAPILAGRGFGSGDLAPGARVVIANQSFVDRVMGGRNPIGRRVRRAAHRGEEPGAWYEIVGVVRDLGMINQSAEGAGLYHPAAPGAISPLYLAVQVRGDPEAFVPRLRAIAAAVDPALRLHEPMPLDLAGFRDWSEMAMLFRLLLLISALALLLSLAGIYAVMSFTVAQRTREIGIRIALGASARRIVGAVLRRPLLQVGAGIGAGGVVAALLVGGVSGTVSLRGVALVLAYAAVMLGACLLACIVPARRALGIQPTEALKAE